MVEADLAIIGAGPAGLAAAGIAAEAGLDVALIDEGAAPGGQIYRGLASASAKRLQWLGEDYVAGEQLLSAAVKPGVRHIPKAVVWEVTPSREILYSQAGSAKSLSAKQIIIATGAVERPMPFPGWTRPGVLTAGAGQILLKTAGLAPPEPLVLAGSGPLLLLLATQYLAAGVEIEALVDTTPPGNRMKALPHLAGALRGHRELRKGIGYLRAVWTAPIRRFSGAASLMALGTGSPDAPVEALAFVSGGRRRKVQCASLLIHTGVVPNTQITRSLNLAHSWAPDAQAWHPVLDADGRSELAGVLVAGDGAGISGAEAAALAGGRAAFAALDDLGHGLSRSLTARRRSDLEKHARSLHIRPFLDRLYAPAAEFLDPPDETIICRCEEVTAAQIRSFVELGCLGPNQAKAFGRCGMGPCQGRSCSLTLSAVIAAKRGVSVAEIGALRIRPPIKPVTIGELAALAPEASSDAQIADS